jgi:DNA-binding MarR family transcriptional regulator
LSAWVALLRGHATLTRELNAQLVACHDLTLNDYEVLLHLSRAPDRRMRRVDLAESVLLTQSGITRLLDGLERAGHVERAECSSDRRVVYAVLTGAGLEKLREAAGTHLEGVQELFAGSFTEGELATLAELLGRLTAGDGAEPCSP